VVGDVDGDRIPDAAFVAANGAAEVVLGLATTPRKIQVDSGVLAADIGRVDGRWGVITVKKTANTHIWSALNLVEATAPRVLAEVSSPGQPVMGCYLDDAYVAAGYKKIKSVGMLTEYSSPTATVVPLPLATLGVRCGNLEEGDSTVFYLNQNAKKKTVTVVGVKNGKNVLTSQRVDPKLKGLMLVAVPRALHDSPTVAILARLGAKQVLQVLDSSNRWRSIALPRVDAGSSVTAMVGVRMGEQTYLVVQITGKARATSYVRLLVPAKNL
jgi:hypothetical protein